MVKTKKSSIWMLKGICDVLTFGPIHRLNALQCLTLEQKDKNPIEAGFSYLHQAAIICEVLRYAPTSQSELVPKSAAILARELGIEELEEEAFISDWSVQNDQIALKWPQKVDFNIEPDLELDIYSHERDSRFTKEGFETALKGAEKCFTAGKMSELSGICLRILLRLADGNLSKLKEISTALNRAQEEALDQESKYGAERFGTYFRVKFYGERFPPEVANREFIFREAMAAKLSEVSEKIKDEAELLGFGFEHRMSHFRQKNVSSHVSSAKPRWVP